MNIPCSGVTRDPFHKYPIRTSKGGGTKCTTCEKRTDCHDCCTCVWPYICVTYGFYCNDLTVLNLDPYLGAIAYDCLFDRYDLSITCDGYYIDLFLKYEKINGNCYATITSEELGFVGEYAITIPFTDISNCRCPQWDFDLGSYGTITVRPYEMVSIGNQRCIDKGPEDCTTGRCLPKYLCAKFFDAANPQGVFTTLTWYENDQIEVDCCCNGNLYPDTLIARFINFGPDCSCISPIRNETQYGPQHGHQITDPGAIVHLKHRVATTGDYFVNNYPFVPSGSNVWVSSGVFGELEQVCPGPTDLAPQYTPTIVSRIMLWCASSGWNSIAEITNKKEADDHGESGYIYTPYSSGNTYSNTYRPSGQILSCNPFHIKLPNIVESGNCYNDETGVFGTGNLEIHIQEFTGWRGPHPFRDGVDVTVYSEVVPVAAPPQTSASDCTPKLHIPDQSGELTLKSRWDVYDAFEVWPDPVWRMSTFFTDELYDTTTKVEISPKPCTACGDVAVDDPYATDVQTECCSNRVPKTLHVRAINLNDCICADGIEFDLIYNPDNDTWEGSSDFCGICSVTMKLTCAGLLGSNIWRLTWGFDPDINTFVWNPSPPALDYAFTCEPFYWLTRTVSNNVCCYSSMAASLFQWEITE